MGSAATVLQRVIKRGQRSAPVVAHRGILNAVMYCIFDVRALNSAAPQQPCTLFVAVLLTRSACVDDMGDDPLEAPGPVKPL